MKMFKVYILRAIPNLQEIKKELFRFLNLLRGKRCTIEMHPSRRGLVEIDGERAVVLESFGQPMTVEDVLATCTDCLPASRQEAQAFYKENPELKAYEKTVIAGTVVMIDGCPHALVLEHTVPSLEPLTTKFSAGTKFLLVLR